MGGGGELDFEGPSQIKAFCYSMIGNMAESEKTYWPHVLMLNPRSEPELG